MLCLSVTRRTIATEDVAAGEERAVRALCPID